MVVVRDEGGQFDGSIETVWRFRNRPELHDPAHKSTRNRRVEPVAGTTMTVRMDRQWRGTWVPVAARETVLPPLGVVSEYVEGPLAGSKLFTVYSPTAEDRTRVDVYGDFKSPVLPPEEVAAAALAWLQEEFGEDAPAIRLLQSGRMDSNMSEPDTSLTNSRPPVT